MDKLLNQLVNELYKCKCSEFEAQNLKSNYETADHYFIHWFANTFKDCDVKVITLEQLKLINQKAKNEQSITT